MSKAGLNSSQKAEKTQTASSKNANPENLLKDYQKMSKHEQLRLLKARKAQHYNIAMFLKKEIVPYVAKNVSETTNFSRLYLFFLRKARKFSIE